MSLSTVLLCGVGVVVTQAPARAADAPVLFGLGNHTDTDRLATERLLDKRSAIVGSFADRTTSPNFWAGWAGQIRSGGAVLQLNWDPTYSIDNDPHSSLRSVLAGEHDAYIRSWTRQVKDFGHPVIIRLWGEMNGSWQPYSPGVNGNTVAEFVPAWRHVVDLARAEGATNIQWDWNPDKPFRGSTPMAPLWPGGGYVDWVGLDVYLQGTAADGWPSFSTLMAPGYAELRGIAGDKPLMLNEVGAATSPLGDKGAWIADMYASMAKFRVRAVVYFDYQMSGFDWRLSQPSSVAPKVKVAVHKAPIVGADDLSIEAIEHLVTRTVDRAPVADLTGDGVTDTTVWRPSTGVWYVPGMAPVGFGQRGDVPVPADYNGGGMTDVAVWRPSDGGWWIRQHASPVVFGQSGDIPVPADYNGDGRADLAVWRPATGTWWVWGAAAQGWGSRGDVPVSGDFNGDGKADLAVYRPSTHVWWVRGIVTATFGQAGDVPIAADYNGDGVTDIAVFRPSTGTWWVRGGAATPYGNAQKVPVPGHYTRNAGSDLAVFTPGSAASWQVRGQSATSYGSTGDVPVALAPALRGFFNLG